MFLEAWKFGIYLGVPILATYWFAWNPERQKEQAEYWQYVKYPANPNVNMREQIAELQKQQQQRQVYRDQLIALNKQAQRNVSNEDEDEATAKRRWWQIWRSA